MFKKFLSNFFTYLIKMRLAQKALQLPFQFVFYFFIFFFIFFLLVTLSGRTAEKLFSERFLISYQECVLPRSDSFPGHTKLSFYKYSSTSCYSRRVWHMTQLMHRNQNSKHPKRHKKQSARNQETSQLGSGWKKILP